MKQMSTKTFQTLLLGMFLSSCGPSGLKLDFGKLTSKELKDKLGGPIRVESTAQGKEVYVYPDDKKFQVDDEIVDASFRKPTAEESSLIYWRHKFKKKKTNLRRLPLPKDSHLMAEQELSCLQEGTTIIYDPNIDKVVRVIEYAKKK
ncbi:MAG: hypothetical protein ACOYL6_06160 [Bacteriovoracaceae bacterium]